MKEVSHNKIFGYIMLIVCIFILGTSLVVGFSINTVTGVLLLIMSICYLSNPGIVYSDTEIEIKNAFGMTMKRYSFLTDNITVEGDTIKAGGKKISASVWILNTEEYNELISFVKNKK